MNLHFHHHHCMGENLSLSNCSVYPNPTNGTVNVSIPNITEKTMIYLYDLQGRKILTKETNQINSSFEMVGEIFGF